MSAGLTERQLTAILEHLTAVEATLDPIDPATFGLTDDADRPVTLAVHPSILGAFRVYTEDGSTVLADVQVALTVIDGASR